MTTPSEGCFGKDVDVSASNPEKATHCFIAPPSAHPKFTPGPWTINKYGSIGAGLRGVDVIVAQVEPFYGPDRKNGSSEANALLISAAPELFDAIFKSDDAHWTPAMRAAMRKAVGEIQ